MKHVLLLTLNQMSQKDDDEQNNFPCYFQQLDDRPAFPLPKRALAKHSVLEKHLHYSNGDSLFNQSLVVHGFLHPARSPSTGGKNLTERCAPEAGPRKPKIGPIYLFVLCWVGSMKPCIYSEEPVLYTESERLYQTLGGSERWGLVIGQSRGQSHYFFLTTSSSQDFLMCEVTGLTL